MFLHLTPGVAAVDQDGSNSPVAAPRPWTWSVIYKADVLGSNSPRTLAAMDNLNAQVDIDAAALFGWDDTALHGELLSNHGSKLNRRVGTVQGISNIEVAQNSARLYATWIEHQFKATKMRALVGLYDLNSEFYATDASGMLIHPSFGIGIDFSQSGRNGPSIFPNLGLGVRIRQPIGQGGYVQAAVLDGTPGDPNNPGRTSISFGRSDGALLVGEVGWQQSDDSGPRPGHWGVGVWQYTREGSATDGGSPQRNHGVYALAQGLLGGSGAGRAVGFVRAGAASRRVNSVDLAFDGGVMVNSPWGPHGPRALTAGVAVARFASASPSRAEVALEIDARWQPLANVAFQPVLQWVLHPSGQDRRAVIAGFRMEWVLEPK